MLPRVVVLHRGDRTESLRHTRRAFYGESRRRLEGAGDLSHCGANRGFYGEVGAELSLGETDRVFIGS